MGKLLSLFVLAEGAIRAALLGRKPRRTILGAVQTILFRLRAGAVGTPDKPGAAWDAVATAYRRAARDAQKAAGSDGSPVEGERHQRSAERLFRSLTQRLDAAIGHVWGDVERTLSPSRSASEVPGGEIPEVKGFTDKAGRRWDLSTYARMCARTTASEAMSEATVNRALDDGEDLVRVSKHPHPHDICSRYEGRVFSISGESRRYPLLVARPPFHPNCRHRLEVFGRR